MMLFRLKMTPTSHMTCSRLLLMAVVCSTTAFVSAAEQKHNSAVAEQPLAQAEAEKLFAERIAPLFKARCLSCHGEGKELKGALDLRTRTSMPSPSTTNASARASPGSRRISVPRAVGGRARSTPNSGNSAPTTAPPTPCWPSACAAKFHAANRNSSSLSS